MPIIIGGGSANGITSFSSPATFQSTVSAAGTLTAPAINTGGTVGTQGQVLASTGSASAWVNGWTLVTTTTVTNASALQDTTSFTSSYKNYMIIFSDFYTVTTSQQLILRLQSGGSYQTSGYLNSGMIITTNYAPTTFIPLGYPGRSVTTHPTYGHMTISNVSSTTVYKPYIHHYGYYDNTGSTYYCGTSHGTWNGTGAITGFQVSSTSGNVTGTAQVYGSN